MDDLLAARWQMAISLGFHIIFACIAMVMPFMMAYTHWKWLKTDKQVYKDLTKAWYKGVAIFFAVGAVSGTVLSFELGLLWPSFMEHAGPIFGMPFSWEGTAFFIEAIALGIFLYGWNRMNRWVHFGSGIVVGIAGVASGILVVAANAWMNSPEGFDWVNGQAINIDPYDAMFNKMWFPQALHMTLAAFVATGFAVAGIHAFLLLRDRKNLFHRTAFRIALTFGSVAALLQPLSGDIAAKAVAENQPEKLAAMEAHFQTKSGADLVIGGIPDEKNQKVNYAIHLPNMLSFLAHGDFNAEVKGLNEFPVEERPPVMIVHISFQVMILLGMFLAGLGILFLIFSWKWKELRYKKWFLKLTVISTTFGFIAVEAGWVVTEVGRQPWIIYKIMKTADSVTPMPRLIYPMILITSIYILLGVACIWLLYRQIKRVPELYPSSLEKE